jgi:hypothetical protein
MVEQRQLCTLALRSRRTVVYIRHAYATEPAAPVRNSSSLRPTKKPGATKTMSAHPSGANVLGVIGLVVIIVVAGAIWLRNNKSYQLTSEP